MFYFFYRYYYSTDAYVFFFADLVPIGFYVKPIFLASFSSCLRFLVYVTRKRSSITVTRGKRIYAYLNDRNPFFVSFVASLLFSLKLFFSETGKYGWGFGPGSSVPRYFGFLLLDDWFLGELCTYLFCGTDNVVSESIRIAVRERRALRVSHRQWPQYRSK